MIAEPRLELPQDWDAVRLLHTAAFGRSEEARLVDALRASGDARLSVVAQRGGQIAGHVLYSELTTAGPPPGRTRVLALAPLAVLPAWQRQGVGSQLVRHSLAMCAAADVGAVIVLGDPAYYGRFGFRAELARNLECVYAGEYLQAVELISGALAGVPGRVEYPAPFGALESHG